MPTGGVIDEIDTLLDSDWARDSASKKSVSSGIVHWQVSSHVHHHVRRGYVQTSKANHEENPR